MTENSDKLRAVVLAALMVFSVFAGTVALSGSAAAVTGGDVSVENAVPSESTTYTATGTFESTDSAETVEVQLDGTNMSGVEAGDVEFTGATSATADSVDSDEGNLTITLGTPGDISGDFTLTIDNVQNPATRGAYSGNITTLSGDTAVESGTLGTYVIGDLTSDGALLFAGQEVVYSTEGDSDGDYVLREGNPDDDDTTAIRQLSVSDGFISIDTGELDTGSYYITNAGEDVANLTFEVIVQDFSAEFDDNSVGNTGDSANTTVEFSSSNRASSFAVNITEEDAALDDEELMDIFGSDETNGSDSGYTAVNADLDDDEDEDGIRLLNIGDGEELDTTFDNVDASEYNFTFEVVDTGVSDSDSIEVTETDEGELSFNDSTLSEQQGDIASINVTFNEATDEGQLIVGDFGESGYQANISVVDDNDDGTVQVMFNTYTAGTEEGAPIVWADSDDDEATLENRNANVQTIGDLLDTTDDGYQLAVSTQTDYEETLTNPDELGTLFIEERSTENITTWVAPDEVFDEYDDLDSASDVTSAIEGGYVTESNSLAEGDVAVFQIQASGLAGIFESNTEDVDLTTFLQNEESISLALEGPDRANQEQRMVDLSSTSSVNVITTQDNNVYLVVDTNNNGLSWQGEDAGNVGDDTSLTANFTVADDRLLDSDDSDDHQTVETDFTSVEPDAEFDGDEPIEVPANEDATISGTTNVAPGTEFTVRVQSDEAEARFIKTNESVLVQPDGTFSAMFDFTDDATVDDTFEATIRDYGGDQVNIDGVVVEATNTTTAANETTTSVNDTTTSDGTTTTEGDTTTSDGTDGGETTTTTPGFTGVLALVALIGAALVALRRDN